MESLEREKLLTAEQVSEWTGISIASLAQRRFMGLPPVFLKPTPKIVRYRESDVSAWLESSVRTSTAEKVPA